MDEPTQNGLSYPEYLELESKTDQRHEFLDGAVRPIAPISAEQAQLGETFVRLVRAALGELTGAVFASDAKIHIEASNRTTYADLFVVCSFLQRATVDPDAMVNPAVIAEVLTDETEAYDRGEKFEHYKRLPSLRDYVLVSLSTPHVEVFSRDNEEWRNAEYGAGESVKLTGLGISIAVDALYANP